MITLINFHVEFKESAFSSSCGHKFNDIHEIGLEWNLRLLIVKINEPMLQNKLHKGNIIFNIQFFKHSVTIAIHRFFEFSFLLVNVTLIIGSILFKINSKKFLYRSISER